MEVKQQPNPNSTISDAPKITKGRLWLFSALTILLCLVFVFGGMELYVRLIVDDGMQFDLEMWKYAREIKRVSADPLIGHEHRPNRHARLMGVDVATNSRGLRDGEYSYERTADTLRILMLGDSFTEGWGVPFEDTSSKRLERLFAQAGMKADVMNTGVGNWDTIDEVEYFLTEGYKYHPDVVVLNFFVNDAESVPQDAPPGFFMRHCYSCVFLAGRIDTALREISDRKNYVDYYLGLYRHGTAKGWLNAKASIKKLADYCKLHSIRLLIASLPELHDVQHYRFQEITDLVHQAAEENGAEFIDLLGSVRDVEASKLWVVPTDTHPNALANKYFADALFRKLRTME